jgi:hypothetical protein
MIRLSSMVSSSCSPSNAVKNGTITGAAMKKMTDRISSATRTAVATVETTRHARSCSWVAIRLDRIGTSGRAERARRHELEHQVGRRKAA